MSNEAIEWSLRQPTGSSGTRQLLMVLADAARDKPTKSFFGREWPPLHAYLSIAALTERTLQDRKTVMANLRRLETGGFIVRAGTDGVTNQSLVYRLQVQQRESVEDRVPVPESPPVPEMGPVPDSTGTSTSSSGDQYRFPPRPVPETGHESLVNPIEPNVSPKKIRASKSRSLAEQFPDILQGVDQQVLEDFQALRSQKRSAVTRTALVNIARQASIAGMTLEAALEMCCARGWQGFRADWAAGAEGNKQSALEARNRAVGERWLAGSKYSAAASGIFEPAWRTEQRERTQQAAPGVAARSTAERRAATIAGLTDPGSIDVEARVVGDTPARRPANTGFEDFDYTEGLNDGPRS